jgi:hypothetical protein
MYVAPGDLGFWQGALRDPGAEIFQKAAVAIEAGDLIVVDLLYGDFEGGQRVITRFSLNYSPFGRRAGVGEGAVGVQHGDAGPRPDDRHELSWVATVARHWNVDRPDPR